ncbi:MAG TPA: HD domain-containing protein [Candidatus Borkfalkia avistercoris]|uniref:HD domain-containing protein n=1 Tax=Candidatus Borkfalkia avistercoris TaxID=2838504 RepID=A0A9D2D099_9FIRM|nr:HD domain-containing protein [Candidatus Borkfalkia avistercoris]
MITVADVKKDEEVKAIMYMAENQIEALGFTEHSVRHSSIVSNWAGEILRGIGADEHRVELAKIAGYLHDIGNSINRDNHAQSGAILAYKILTRMGMSYMDAADVMMAIGNHDEHEGLPVSDITSALILADKADVHKSRVRANTTRMNTESLNIHDRVNLAAEKSAVYVDQQTGEIILNIVIDTDKCPVMDYFEIYFGRMQLCRRAADFLGRKFVLIINDVRLL